MINPRPRWIQDYINRCNHVGFTGTRTGMTNRQKAAVRRILQDHNPYILHHGDCVGADAESHDISDLLGMSKIIHPPEDGKNRAFCMTQVLEYRKPSPYLARDRCMVDEVGVFW